MPCPANPQPPGLFDFTAPHTTFGLWAGLIGTGAVALLVLFTLFSLRRKYRRSVPGAQRTLVLWLDAIFAGVGCILIALEIGAIFWRDALSVWYASYPYYQCTAIDAVMNYARNLPNDLQLAAALGLWVWILLGAVSHSIRNPSVRKMR